MNVFEIHHSCGLHRFRARWDEKASTVDIDKFTKGARGKEHPTKSFPGHHTHQPDAKQRRYEVDLWDGANNVLKGAVSFRVTRRIAFAAAQNVPSGGLTTAIPRHPRHQRFWNRLRRAAQESWRRASNLFRASLGFGA